MSRVESASPMEALITRVEDEAENITKASYAFLSAYLRLRGYDQVCTDHNEIDWPEVVSTDPNAQELGIVRLVTDAVDYVSDEAARSPLDPQTKLRVYKSRITVYALCHIFCRTYFESIKASIAENSMQDIITERERLMKCFADETIEALSRVNELRFFSAIAAQEPNLVPFWLQKISL